MTPATRHTCAHKLVAAPFAFLLGLAGLAACGDEETDPKEFGDVDKVGEKVTVRAEVSEVISDHSFAVTGTEITSLDEILVVSAADVDVREEHEVEVTGILREDFDAVRVGEELGLFWEERPYQAWNGEHYIQATRVEKQRRSPGFGENGSGHGRSAEPADVLTRSGPERQAATR